MRSNSVKKMPTQKICIHLIKFSEIVWGRIKWIIPDRYPLLNLEIWSLSYCCVFYFSCFWTSFVINWFVITRLCDKMHFASSAKKKVNSLTVFFLTTDQSIKNILHICLALITRRICISSLVKLKYIMGRNVKLYSQANTDIYWRNLPTDVTVNLYIRTQTTLNNLQ